MNWMNFLCRFLSCRNVWVVLLLLWILTGYLPWLPNPLHSPVPRVGTEVLRLWLLQHGPGRRTHLAAGRPEPPEWRRGGAAGLAWATSVQLYEICTKGHSAAAPVFIWLAQRVDWANACPYSIRLLDLLSLFRAGIYPSMQLGAWRTHCGQWPVSWSTSTRTGQSWSDPHAF